MQVCRTTFGGATAFYPTCVLSCMHAREGNMGCWKVSCFGFGGKDQLAVLGYGSMGAVDVFGGEKAVHDYAIWGHTPHLLGASHTFLDRELLNDFHCLQNKCDALNTHILTFLLIMPCQYNCCKKIPLAQAD